MKAGSYFTFLAQIPIPKAILGISAVTGFSQGPARFFPLTDCQLEGE